MNAVFSKYGQRLTADKITNRSDEFGRDVPRGARRPIEVPSQVLIRSQRQYRRSRIRTLRMTSPQIPMTPPSPWHIVEASLLPLSLIIEADISLDSASRCTLHLLLRRVSVHRQD